MKGPVVLRRRSFRTAAVLGAAAVALTLTACGGAAPEATRTTAAAGETPGPEALQTVTDGTFTVATGEPAYAPWVEDDHPESGRGFEAAVAYAVADQLGYAKEDVTWVRSTFDAAIAPGPKAWDVNIQQFSITDDRRQAVDFSSPYYTTAQAVVTTKGSDAASATTVAALKSVKIGVAASTTSYDVVNEQVGQPQVFNSNDDAVQALSNGQVDAIVVDLPTAFYLAGVEIEGGVVSGQFPGTEGGDQFGFVLQKDSPLTAAVTDAVDAIDASGELAELTEQWLSSEVDVPVLQ